MTLYRTPTQAELQQFRQALKKGIGYAGRNPWCGCDDCIVDQEHTHYAPGELPANLAWLLHRQT